MTQLFSRRLRARGRTLVLAAALALLGSPAAAQVRGNLPDLPIEDLLLLQVEPVVGASFHAQPVTEAPSAVSIVTADDIARHGYRSLAEILRSVRGMYVSYDRNYSYAGTRGVSQFGDYNTRILLLVDGHRVNDGVYDQAPLGPELGIDVAAFERVEVIRGPVSALYGGNAFFAVVNVTTRSARTSPGLVLSAEGGGLGHRRLFASYGHVFADGATLSVRAHGEAVSGNDTLYFPEFDDGTASAGLATGADGERVHGVNGRLLVGPFAVTGAYGWRRKTVPTGAYDTRFNDPSFKTIDRRGFLDVDFDQAWSSTTLTLHGAVDFYGYDATYPYEPLTPGDPTAIAIDRGRATWLSTEARFRRIFDRHAVTAGLEHRSYLVQDQESSYSDERFPAFSTDASSRVEAAYIQDEVTVGRWILSGGVRYDAYTGFDRLSPRASVIYLPTASRALKYLFGSAFRPPNAYELDYLGLGIRNHDLRAETISTHEVVWEEYNGWLRTAVSAYWNEGRNLLSLMTDDDGAQHYGNTSRIHVRGLELENELRFRNGSSALVSYAIQHAADGSKDELTNSPRHLATMRLGVPFVAAGSTLALDVQAMSRRLALDGSRVEAQAVTNVSYRHPLRENLWISAVARNVFDAELADPGAPEHRQRLLRQDGRTLRVTVDWHWTP